MANEISNFTIASTNDNNASYKAIT